MQEMLCFPTKVVSESKNACEVLCFTIEMAVGGCEGMFEYVRISPPLGSAFRELQIAL